MTKFAFNNFLVLALLCALAPQYEAQAKPAKKVAQKVQKAQKAKAVARPRAVQAAGQVARQARPSTGRAPAASSMASIGGVQESQKAIQVTGQSRNLSMMLVLKNEKDKINFVEVRRDFRKEIGGTQY